LNQANKARESEAKTYVGSMNRGQQAFYLENDTFGADIGALQIGIPTTTGYYTYASVGGTNAVSTGTKKVGSSVKNFTGTVTINTTTGVTTATLVTS
jgi:hypothetical protein